jgi:protein-L-isoaspartate(D-aspartate) O-methyltransferase
VEDTERDIERRHRMVAEQIERRGVRDAGVLQAMRKVPRHRFIPEAQRAHAYEDRALPIGEAQTISQPYMVAVMTALLQLTPESRVLEIGTGSGYQGAILAELAATVVSLERRPELAEAARAVYRELGIQNVEVIIADGSCGYPPRAPYDAIVVTAAAPRVPEALKSQLADGGRLVIPVGAQLQQELAIVTRDGDAFREARGEGCVFVPLIGVHGWSDKGGQP